MKKISINHAWLFWLIPLCMFVFVGFPQLKRTYNLYEKRVQKYEQEKVELDSLRQANVTSSKAKHRLKTLEITVPITEKVILREQYTYYKTGGMLGVLALMFIGVFGSGYFARKKKTAPTNKRVDFTFEDSTQDAIGQSVSWEATKSSGSNFYSQQLKKTSYGYKVTNTTMLKVIPLAFFLMGFNYVVWSFIEYFQFNNVSLTFMKAGNLFFTSGGVFMLVGAILFFVFSSKTQLDKRKRNVTINGTIIPFQKIYALQLLQKFVSSNNSEGYFCYELNLVTNSGDRINLLNHGDKEYILSDMIKISQFLKVPVWNHGVV
jgi:hypothetical protein